MVPPWALVNSPSLPASYHLQMDSLALCTCMQFSSHTKSCIFSPSFPSMQRLEWDWGKGCLPAWLYIVSELRLLQVVTEKGHAPDQTAFPRLILSITRGGEWHLDWKSMGFENLICFTQLKISLDRMKTSPMQCFRNAHQWERGRTNRLS